jgi:hypothetical protein
MGAISLQDLAMCGGIRCGDGTFPAPELHDRHASTPARQHASTPARQHASTPARLRVGTPARLRVGTPARLRVGTPARLRVGTPARLHVGRWVGGWWVSAAVVLAGWDGWLGGVGVYVGAALGCGCYEAALA